MMRLSGELAPEAFEALVVEYQRLLREVLAAMGGLAVDLDGDTATAAFPSAKQAALAAVGTQRAVAAHEWPHGRRLEMSVGLDSGSADQTIRCCEELCDAAEGGEVYLTQRVSDLLEDEDLGELSVRDLGEVALRRTDRKVRASELVFPLVEPRPA